MKYLPYCFAKRFANRFVKTLVGVVLVLIAFWLGASNAKAQFSYMPALQNGPPALCRLGINGSLLSYDVKPLRLGWFLDYTVTATPPTGINYFLVLRLEQTPNGYNYSLKPGRPPATAAELRAAVAARPGHYWIIGNEPDRAFYQDDLEPQVYARAYHDLYTIIKEEDPTAKIVAGTIVQPTPIRLQYLDKVLEGYFQAYKEMMPVDVWSIHNFILNEASCSYYENKVPSNQLLDVCWGADIPPGVSATDGLRIQVKDNDRVDLFKEQVIRFRQWMADRGYRDTPAFVTEFGVLMPQALYPEFSTERVNSFMNQTFDFMLNTTDPNIGYPGDNNRLIQRFAWYSVDDNTNHNGNIFDRNRPLATSRTAMGDNFANYANAQAESVDFYLDDLRQVGAPPLVSQGTTTVTVQAVVGNSGNLAVGTAAIVTFFNGNPGAGGVQIGDAQSVSLPGCGEQSAVQMDWASVPPGNYTVYAQIQSASGDLDQSNNLGSVAVSFSNQHLFIPALKHALVIAP